MKLNVQILGNELIRIGQSVNGFVLDLQGLAENEQVQAIAAEFPGGTAIDTACITLCNDATAAINALPKTVANVERATTAIYNQLKADLAQVKHNNPKHNIGYYIKLVGVVMEDLAADVKSAA